MHLNCAIRYPTVFQDVPHTLCDSLAGYSLGAFDLEQGVVVVILKGEDLELGELLNAGEGEDLTLHALNLAADVLWTSKEKGLYAIFQEWQH